MSKLHLSRLILNTRNPRIQLANAQANEMHKLLLKAFEFPVSETPRRDTGLLYRLDGDNSGEDQVLLVQSSMEPHWKFAQKQGLVVTEGVDVKEISPMFPLMTEGRMLRFRIMLNARSRVYRKGASRGDHKDNVNLPDVIEWMRRREESLGFALSRDYTGAIQLDVSRKQSTPIGRRQSDAVRGCRVDGVLAVTDTTTFEQTVREGIGRARTYGFGLLSLMPHNQM